MDFSIYNFYKDTISKLYSVGTGIGSGAEGGQSLNRELRYGYGRTSTISPGAYSIAAYNPSCSGSHSY